MERKIDKEMRSPFHSHSQDLDERAVIERDWGSAARVDECVTFEEHVYWAKIERKMEAEEAKE